MTPKIDARIALVASVIGTICIASGFYFLSYTDSAKEIESLTLEDQQLQQQVLVANQQKADLQTKREQNQVMEDQLLAFQKRIPSQEDLTALLHLIKMGANENNIAFETITQVGGTTSTGAIERISFNTELNGSFPNLYRYVQWLHNQERFVNIDGLNLVLRDNGRVSTGSTITAFMYHPEQIKPETANTNANTTPTNTTEQTAASPAASTTGGQPQ